MSPTPDKKIEAIRQIYSALSRGDADAALSLFDANAFRIEFEGSPNSGSFRGLEALKKHFEDGRSTWAEGACNPVEFYPAADRVVVKVHVKVRLKNHSEWIDAHTTDGFAFKNNVVTEFHSFTTKQKALDWAGISALKMHWLMHLAYDVFVALFALTSPYLVMVGIFRTDLYEAIPYSRLLPLFTPLVTALLFYGGMVLRKRSQRLGRPRIRMAVTILASLVGLWFYSVLFLRPGPDLGEQDDSYSLLEQREAKGEIFDLTKIRPSYGF